MILWSSCTTYVSRNAHIIHQERSTIFASVKLKTLNLEPFNTLQPIHAKVMKIHIIICTKKQTPHEKPTKVITRVSRFEWLTKFCTATTSLYMNNSRSGHQVEGIIMKRFVVVVVDVVEVVVVMVVFLTETNDTTKRVDLQQVSLNIPPPPLLVESRRNRVS